MSGVVGLEADCVLVVGVGWGGVFQLFLFISWCETGGKGGVRMGFGVVFDYPQTARCAWSRLEGTQLVVGSVTAQCRACTVLLRLCPFGALLWELWRINCVEVEGCGRGCWGVILWGLGVGFGKTGNFVYLCKNFETIIRYCFEFVQ